MASQNRARKRLDLKKTFLTELENTQKRSSKMDCVSKKKKKCKTYNDSQTEENFRSEGSNLWEKKYTNSVINELNMLDSAKSKEVPPQSLSIADNDLNKPSTSTTTVSYGNEQPSSSGSFSATGVMKITRGENLHKNVEHIKTSDQSNLPQMDVETLAALETEYFQIVNKYDKLLETTDKTKKKIKKKSVDIVDITTPNIDRNINKNRISDSFKEALYTIDLVNPTNSHNSGTVTVTNEVIEILDETFHMPKNEVIVLDDTCDSIILKECSMDASPDRISNRLGNCAICLENLTNKEIMSTMCGHVFCKACIMYTIKTTKHCPNCRTKLTLKSIHPLFLP